MNVLDKSVPFPELSNFEHLENKIEEESFVCLD